MRIVMTDKRKNLMLYWFSELLCEDVILKNHHLHMETPPDSLLWVLNKVYVCMCLLQHTLTVMDGW